MTETTICALSTPIGTGGIAVIRVSGPKSLEIVNSIFKGKSLLKVPSHHAVHGYILDKDTKEKIDEVLVLCMKGPNTFTGEDTVEINCHGGMYICRRILESLLRAGCHSAAPGEFSKRSFMNGKMDLNEAEAVMDMIGAQTTYSLRSAVGQLGGALSGKIDEIRKTLLDLLVMMEVNIDYPEYDVPEISDEEVLEGIVQAKSEIQKLLKNADSGKLLRSGIAATLIGSPNVGKSSLLNLLLGEQRAIVTEIPGTTRDVLEEMLDLDGILIRLMDTAGIRKTEDTVEKIGVSRSLDSLEKSDLVLWVLDGSRPISKEDRELWEKIGNKPYLILVNKADLLADLSDKEEEYRREIVASLNDGENNDLNGRILFLSAKEQTGKKELSEKIKELFFSGDVLDEGKPLVTNARQKEALMRAEEALVRAEGAYGMPQDLLSIDIRQAFEDLGDVNGSTSSDEIVTEIFSRFCLGK